MLVGAKRRVLFFFTCCPCFFNSYGNLVAFLEGSWLALGFAAGCGCRGADKGCCAYFISFQLNISLDNCCDKLRSKLLPKKRWWKYCGLKQPVADTYSLNRSSATFVYDMSMFLLYYVRLKCMARVKSHVGRTVPQAKSSAGSKRAVCCFNKLSASRHRFQSLCSNECDDSRIPWNCYSEWMLYSEDYEPEIVKGMPRSMNPIHVVA